MNNIIYKGSDGSIRTLGDNELQHWKYIKKIPAGSGYRYFYSWDEWRAYLADPAAQAQKTGQKAAKQIQSTRRSAQKYISKGRKQVNKIINKSDRSKMTMSSIKKINASRSSSFRKRINELAKRASEKWKSGGEAIKDSIKKGEAFVKNIIELPGKKIEEHKKAKEKIRAEKRENLAKKYKYIKRIKINGEYKYFYSQEEIDAYEKRNDYMKNEPDFMKDVKHSDSPYTAEEDAIQVNPEFDPYDFNYDYEYNCAECTAIYELRRRGYDVESNGESALGPNSFYYNTDLRFSLFYEDAQTNYLPPAKNDEEALKNLQSEFDKMPPGSRGDISFSWKDGGGHSIVWEKDDKGEVHLIDTQLSGHGNRIEYDMKGLISKTDNTSINSDTQITRTDNLKLKPEIKNICKDTKDKKRTKPNTTTAWDYDMESNTLKPRAMTEKEITKKYSNLT